ncbi:MAG: hypothetical protein IAX21_11095 [Candidatus Bathyarchaeota archaeon]|nr:hypothetical protein [Candidatus Bathyarchaeum tardum]WGM88587.1 MAG: hypothetical protein NUK63_06590 [Candidatus Bathyarchaeum tardum]WNZ29157.1 MAG: hypothetical protein IAX21_11095 [Candidatus Bathyarchaeota archaeon]
MQTRDVTMIIVMAVLQLVISVSIAQMGTLITGIPGTNFLFTILLAIPISFSLLWYEGRRWRIFFQLALFSLISIPTFIGGAPYDPTPRLSSIATAFLIDIFANSSYGFFNKTKKLLWWSLLTSSIYWVLTPFLKIGVSIIFYSPEFVERFTSVVLGLFPIIIAQAIAGGYIGYKIYKNQIRF